MRGLRVVDLSTGIAGAYCARLFATTGADVVVAEPADGSPLRRAGPLVDVPRRRPGEPAVGVPRRRQAQRRHRRGDEDRSRARCGGPTSSCSTTTGGRPTRRHASSGSASSTRPRSSPCSAGSGSTARTPPWRSSPLGDWAAGGHLFLTGDVDREPLQGGGPWDTYLHGAVAAVGTAAAAIHAARTGEGQVVDVSAIEALASMHQWTVTMYTHNGTVKRRWGNLLGESSHPIALYRCQDGDISIVAVSPPQWEALCIAMELWDLLADRRLDVIGERFDRAAEIDAQINEWLSTRTVDEAIEYLQGRGVPASRLLTMSQVLHEEQLAAAPVLRRARGARRGSGDAVDAVPPRGSRRRRSGPPRRSAPTPPTCAPGSPTRARAARSSTSHDVRILEFGIAWAGPLAGRFLGDFGADVVKVEHPATRGVLPPDPTYADGWTWGTLPHPMVRFPVYPDNEPGERWWNRSGMFNKINRSKRSIGLDAKTGSGDDVLRGLIAASDIVLNNYSPRGARSLGIDPASVRASNPLGITVSMSGYGSSGPLARNMSYGPVLQAHGGFDEATGYVGGGAAAARRRLSRRRRRHPRRVRHPRRAVGAGAHRRSGPRRRVAARDAAGDRRRHGPGDVADGRRSRQRHGNRSPTASPQGVYPCADDDSWVAITIDGDEAWRALVDVIGGPELLPRTAPTTSSPAGRGRRPSTRRSGRGRCGARSSRSPPRCRPGG